MSPRLVREVPTYGLGALHGQRLRRAPSERTLRLRAVDRVAEVVALAVWHELDQRARRPRCTVQLVVDDVGEKLDQMEVRHLLAATEVVALAELTTGHRPPQAVAVIVDVQPLADLLACPVDRQRLASAGIPDHQRQ